MRATSVTVFILLMGLGCSRGPAPNQATPPPIENLTRLDPPVRARLKQLHQNALKEPADAENWGKLGEAFHALELLPQAEVCYSNAVQRDATSARWHYLLGVTQLRDSSSTALTNMAAAIKLVPGTNDFIRLAYGKALAERGRTDEAAHEFETLLAAEPAHAAARLELARIKFFSGDAPAALKMLGPCLTNQFTARPARLLLAQAKLKVGDTAAAAQLSQSANAMPKPFDWPDPFLREVRATLPLKASLLDQANMLLGRERYTEAEAVLNSLLEQHPNDPESVLLFGRLRAQQKRFGEAEELFLKHLSNDPNSIQGWMQLGIARFRREKWAGAADAFKRATEIKPDYAEAHANLGLAYSRLKDSPQAIAAFKSALRCDPGDTRAMLNLAEEFLRQGQPREAAETASAVLQINPRDSRALKIKEIAGSSGAMIQ